MRGRRHPVPRPGHPCKDKYGDSFENTIRNKTYPDLVKALKAVHKRSPRAEVAILGYPWITPPTKGCFDKMPIATGDVPYVHHIQWTLNDAVRRAAAATGTTYVNMNKVSTGHDACKPIGVRWVEPVPRAPTRSSYTPTPLARPDGRRRQCESSASS